MRTVGNITRMAFYMLIIPITGFKDINQRWGSDFF